MNRQVFKFKGGGTTIYTSNKFYVADAHCDTVIDWTDGERKFNEYSPKGHVDLSRLVKGGIKLQFFAAFIEQKYKPASALERALKLIDGFYEEIKHNSNELDVIYTADDVYKIINSGKIAALLTVEGGEAIKDDISFLRILFRLGVRGMTLTWNYENAIGSGAKEGSSDRLTEFGLEVINEMNKLGMIIDVSHLNRAGFFDVINNTKTPIIASHSNVKALCNHPRNLDDKQLWSIAENGGLICISFVPYFLTDKKVATNHDVVEHINYVKKKIGINYIGIGSDFDGVDKTAQGLEDASKMQVLAKILSENGYKDYEIEKILSANLIRFVQEVLIK